MAEAVHAKSITPPAGKRRRPSGRSFGVAAAQLAILALVFTAGGIFSEPVREGLQAHEPASVMIAANNFLVFGDGVVPYAILCLVGALLLFGGYNLWRLLHTSALIQNGISDVLAGDYTKRIPVRGGGFERDVYSDFNLMVKTCEPASTRRTSSSPMSEVSPHTPSVTIR